MDETTFKLNVKRHLEYMESLLALKNKGYAHTSEDRLYNFKEGAKLANSTPLQYAWSLVVKHITKMRIMKDHPTDYTSDDFSEVATDIAIYMILMTILHKEEV